MRCRSEINSNRVYLWESRDHTLSITFQLSLACVPRVEVVVSECPYAMSSSRQPPEAPSSEPKKGAICQDFNGGKGKGCKWGANCYHQHICSDCWGAHPKFKCPNKKPEPPVAPSHNRIPRPDIQ